MKSTGKPVGFVLLTLRFRKTGDHWDAYCEELGTATFARTLEAAKEKIIEAVCLHLNTLEEVGERERFFKEHKIKIHLKKPERLSIINDPSYYSTPFILPLNPALAFC